MMKLANCFSKGGLFTGHEPISGSSQEIYRTLSDLIGSGLGQEVL